MAHLWLDALPIACIPVEGCLLLEEELTAKADKPGVSRGVAGGATSYCDIVDASDQQGLTDSPAKQAVGGPQTRESMHKSTRMFCISVHEEVSLL